MFHVSMYFFLLFVTLKNIIYCLFDMYMYVLLSSRGYLCLHLTFGYPGQALHPRTESSGRKQGL